MTETIKPLFAKKWDLGLTKPIALRMKEYLEDFFSKYHDTELEQLCRMYLSHIQPISGRNPKALVATLIYFCGSQISHLLLPQSKLATFFHITDSTLRNTFLFLTQHHYLEI